MVQRAVVLAHRLAFHGGGSVAPAAVALVRRTLQSLAQIGVRHVCVVDGEHADLLRDRLALHELPSLQVEVRANRSWRQGSGTAVLVARDFVLAAEGDQGGACLVLRGDRPLDAETLASLAVSELGTDDAVIVVAEPDDGEPIDLSAEAKVLLRDDDGLEVRSIGLDVNRWDAIFTGHALVSNRILGALAGHTNPTLADGIERLLATGHVRALPGRLAWVWGEPPIEVSGQVEALLDAKKHPRYTLLNPGPVQTTSNVKSALVHYDVCHRDAAFAELMVQLTGKLRRVFRASAQHTVTMVTGSGTAAMECALSSTVPHDRKILVIDNGAFGERLLEIARLHEMDVVHLRYAWGDLVDPADVERAFDAHPDIAVVAMIHHETSVGLLNPVREVGAICRRRDALLIVDAVSSLGAEDLDVVRDNIDVCYSSANKCLHAISGAAFLCVAPRVWAKIETVKPRSYYLDLKRYRRYMEELAQTPFTPAVSTYFALDVACDELLADGVDARRTDYRRRNQRLRQGLAALGMYPFTRTGRESHSIVTCAVPSGVSFGELYEELKARGYIVYACKDVLAERFLQVANMGDLDDRTIESFLETAREVIQLLRARAAAASQSWPAVQSNARLA